MDRIYYFRLTKEKSRNKRCRQGRRPDEFPVFRDEIGEYEVYYLQISDDAKKDELAAIKAQMEKGIQRIATWYCSEENGNNAYLVYEASFAQWLKDRQLETYWQKLWDLPLYREYKEAHNLQFLIRQIPGKYLLGHLVILGEAPGLREWICPVARQMKKITLFSMTKPRGFESLREQLLEEYGQIIGWENSLQPISSEPALVLDYCEKERIYIWGIPRNSIWIDMTSMEERRHALEDRETGIQYISLKSIWKEEMLQTLDTASKIQYNTVVKLEG